MNKHGLTIFFTDGSKLILMPGEWDEARIEGSIALIVYKNNEPVVVAPIRNFFRYEVYEEG